MKDNTQRFSNRVDAYVKYRPSYPVELFDRLVGDYGMNTGSTVADIGSGTGIFTGLLLDRVKTVYAVEPNDGMRGEAEKLLGGRNGFVSIRGTAENTTLKEGSVDFITAAQAFHWFDRETAAREFRRILKEGGFVFLVWNKRRENTGFQMAYERIVRTNIPEYREVNHHNVTKDIIRSFLPADFSERRFAYSQVLDWEGVLGRLNSSSYTPLPGTGTYDTLVRELKGAFDQYASNGRMAIDYETELYAGRPA